MPALRALCASIVFASTLAACSGGAKTNGATNPPTTTTPTPTPTPADPGVGGNGSSSGDTTADAGGIVDGGASTPVVPPIAPLSHHRCGWLNDDIALGKASFNAHTDYFDAIHPYWFTLNADGTFSATNWVDDADVIATARAHHIQLMPLVYGGDSATSIRNIIGSSTAIAAEVNTLVQLAVSRQYDGLEMDYEHLWQGSDRAGYTALMTALAKALHAQGKTLSIAVPAIDVDYQADGYDYGALAAGGVDVIHLMGYDFHSTTTHLGPLAPIGWIDAVGARVQKLGVGKSFILGIGNYGVGSGWYDNSANLISQCGPVYPTTTDHMLTCPFGTYAAGISPHCTTAKGDVWFEDASSMAEKARTALARGLRGVAYYSLGGEPAGLFDAMRAAYP